MQIAEESMERVAEVRGARGVDVESGVHWGGGWIVLLRSRRGYRHGQIYRLRVIAEDGEITSQVSLRQQDLGIVADMLAEEGGKQ